MSNEATTLQKFNLSTTTYTILTIAILPSISVPFSILTSNLFNRYVPYDENGSELLILIGMLLCMSPIFIAIALIAFECEKCKERLNAAGYHEKEGPHWYHFITGSSCVAALVALNWMKDDLRMQFTEWSNWAGLSVWNMMLCYGLVWIVVTEFLFLVFLAPVIWHWVPDEVVEEKGAGDLRVVEKENSV